MQLLITGGTGFFGKALLHNILGQPIPGAARNRYVPDISKAQRELSLGVLVSRREAIAQFASIIN